MDLAVVVSDLEEARAVEVMEGEVVLAWAVVVLVLENFGPKKSHGSIFQYSSLVRLLLQEVHAQWVG